MLQSWLSGLNKLCERGTGRLTFSSKHQCVCGLSPGPATAGLCHTPGRQDGYNAELLRGLLRGPKDKQLQLPSFGLGQSL